MPTTAVDQKDHSLLFVTNVPDGTAERITLSKADKHGPTVASRTQIGSGFAHRADPGALFIGPTGDAAACSGALCVADWLSNRIAAIPSALTRTSTAFAGTDVSSGQSLNDPLGLTLAPNGDILTVNGNDGTIIETDPTAAADSNEVATITLPPGGGGLFGLAVVPDGSGVYFVNDTDNELDLLHWLPPRAQSGLNRPIRLGAFANSGGSIPARGRLNWRELLTVQCVVR